MFPRSAWLATAIAALIMLVLGLARLRPRIQAEGSHQNLTIALDFQQLDTLANDEGFDLDTWLTDLKAKGFDHLALSEDTPLWLEQRGFCSVVEGFEVTKSVAQKDNHVEGPQPLILTPEAKAEAKRKEKPEINYAPRENAVFTELNLSPGDLHLLFPEEPTGGNLLAQMLVLNAQKRLGAARVSIEDRPESHLVIVTLKGKTEDLVDMGLGFVSPTARHLKSMGFAIIPRVRNQRALTTPTLVDDVISDASRAQAPGPNLIIGEGDEILGFPKALPETADAIRRAHLLFGMVEFAKQSGDKALADTLIPGVVRVHSISDEEMDIYSPANALDRYLLAAQERNVRIVYLKPFHQDLQGVNLQQYNTDYFESVRKGLVDEGFQISSIDNGTISHPLLPWPTASPVTPPSRLLGLIALLVAVAFPLIGLYLLTANLPAFQARADRGDPYGAAAIAILWLWGWGIMGAVIQASLLSNAYYMLETRSFSGVSLALLGPVLLAGILWVRVLVDNPPRGIWDQAVMLGNFPIHVKHLVAGGVVLLATMIIALRSGNEPVGGVSPVELAFRSMLGHLLDVRPRTKEFLIGHPALVIGMFLLFHRRRAIHPWAYPFLVIGTLGITSMINTFQHFHTPVLISVHRTILGMGMGIVLGLIGCGVAALVIRFAVGSPRGPEPDSASP